MSDSGYILMQNLAIFGCETFIDVIQTGAVLRGGERHGGSSPSQRSSLLWLITTPAFSFTSRCTARKLLVNVCKFRWHVILHKNIIGSFVLKTFTQTFIRHKFGGPRPPPPSALLLVNICWSSTTHVWRYNGCEATHTTTRNGAVGHKSKYVM